LILYSFEAFSFLDTYYCFLGCFEKWVLFRSIFALYKKSSQSGCPNA